MEKKHKISERVESSDGFGDVGKVKDLLDGGSDLNWDNVKGKGKGHPCTGTEALYRPYGP